MLEWLLTTSALQALLARTTIADRLGGIRRVFIHGSGLGRLWLIPMVIVLAGAVAVLVSMVHRRRQTEQQWEEFQQEGARAGLRDEELRILKHVVTQSGLRIPRAIFTAQRAFELGVNHLMRSKKVAAMSNEMSARLTNLLKSIREKLGFDYADGSEAVSSSQQIAVGSKLSIATLGAIEPVEATVVGNAPSELIVETTRPIEARPGEVLVIRHSIGPSMWEFEASVIRTDNGKVFLMHSQDVRMVNRRRFPRVATDRPARLALFPFHVEDLAHETPVFVAGRLVEIAGPGLLLESPLQAEVGQKVLVTVNLPGDQLLEGLAKVRVRRAPLDGQGRTLLGVELVGLNSDEVAELVRHTNVALAHSVQEQEKNQAEVEAEAVMA